LLSAGAVAALVVRIVAKAAVAGLGPHALLAFLRRQIFQAVRQLRLVRVVWAQAAIVTAKAAQIVVLGAM